MARLPLDRQLPLAYIRNVKTKPTTGRTARAESAGLQAPDAQPLPHAGLEQVPGGVYAGRSAGTSEEDAPAQPVLPVVSKAARTLGRLGGLAGKRKGRDYAELGRLGGKAGKDRKKPRKPKAVGR